MSGIATRSYAERRGSAGIQPLLQRSELCLDLTREPIAEPSEVLLQLRQLLAQLIQIDLEEVLQAAVPELQAIRVDVLRSRHPADRAVEGVDVTVTAAEDPLEHAAVLAEAGPDEVAVGVLAEPVDEKDPRHL